MPNWLIHVDMCDGFNYYNDNDDSKDRLHSQFGISGDARKPSVIQPIVLLRKIFKIPPFHLPLVSGLEDITTSYQPWCW